jgi:type VI secretion system protein ImpB
VAQQVPAVKKLLELRQQLADLRGSIQTNEALEEILQESVGDGDALARLKTELESEAPDEEDSDG